MPVSTCNGGEAMKGPTKHLLAAIGYLDIRLAQDAWAELEGRQQKSKDRNALLEATSIHPDAVVTEGVSSCN